MKQDDPSELLPDDVRELVLAFLNIKCPERRKEVLSVAKDMAESGGEIH